MANKNVCFIILSTLKKNIQNFFYLTVSRVETVLFCRVCTSSQLLQQQNDIHLVKSIMYFSCYTIFTQLNYINDRVKPLKIKQTTTTGFKVFALRQVEINFPPRSLYKNLVLIFFCSPWWFRRTRWKLLLKSWKCLYFRIIVVKV